MPGRQKMFPRLVALYVLLTGVFFLVNALVDIQIITVDPLAAIRLAVIAALLTGSGAVFVYLTLAGRHKKEGPTITEVRKEAVSGLDSESLLADIVRNDPEPEVRRVAAQRLKEMDAET